MTHTREEKEIYEEIGYTVIYSFKEGGAHVDFKAYEIIGHNSADGKEFNIPMYEAKEIVDGEQDTNDITKAQTAIHGVVKWDGCSHYYFGDEGYIHLCGDRFIENISKLIKKVYCRCGEIGSFTEEFKICKDC